jgi:hypothetical protein
MNGSTNGPTIVRTNGSTTALRRLYDGYMTALRRLYYRPKVAHTIVGTNGSASSLRRLYERPYSIVSTTALHRLYDGSTIAHTIIYTNGSTMTLRYPFNRPYERLYIVSTNCPACSPPLRTALHRLYKQLYKRL